MRAGINFTVTPEDRLRLEAIVGDRNAKPFVWTADPQKVLAAVKRGKKALESVH